MLIIMTSKKKHSGGKDRMFSNVPENGTFWVIK